MHDRMRADPWHASMSGSRSKQYAPSRFRSPSSPQDARRGSNCWCDRAKKKPIDISNQHIEGVSNA